MSCQHKKVAMHEQLR